MSPIVLSGYKKGSRPADCPRTPYLACLLVEPSCFSRCCGKECLMTGDQSCIETHRWRRSFAFGGLASAHHLRREGNRRACFLFYDPTKRGFSREVRELASEFADG
jgi:hypothetical protein